MPDSELVVGVIEGRIDFAELRRRFEHVVFGGIFRLVKNRPDAEELTQRVFVRVFEWLGRFDPRRASFRTWLYEITTSIVMDYFRARKRAPESLDAMAETQLPTVAGPAEHFEARRKRTELARALRRLSPIERGSFFGFRVRHLPWKMVAAELGCTERAAQYHCEVALRKLRRWL